MIKWSPDPYRTMIVQVQKRHPSLKVEISFNSPAQGEKWLGRTIFPGNGSVPQIYLNVNCTLGESLDILAHELAHAVCGYKAKHGVRWKKEYKRIYNDWLKAMDKFYDM